MVFPRHVRSVTATATLLVTAMQSGTALRAETIPLKFSTMEAPIDPFAKCFTLPLLSELEDASGGRIKVETYMGGTAFAHPLHQYEQVAEGAMDLSQGGLSSNPGQFALAEVATMPLLVREARVSAAAINRLAPRCSPTSSPTSTRWRSSSPHPCICTCAARWTGSPT